ncbi:hypothetical protein [Paenibacillus sp. XY044]|uniref:hypothetical protein n=1 Tax=Paenibacillus sp. XY044 TaxID=2026089 RepID=UPI0015C58774|nr:hypothetical protein [Paenibacillus sp. XY044]
MTINPGFVQLDSKVRVSLQDVNIWKQAEGNILSYTLVYSNGSSSASLMNYFSKVATPGGSVVQGSPVNAEGFKKSLISREQRRVTYYANIGQVDSLKGLKFPMYIWADHVSGFMKHTGTFALPENYSNQTVYGNSRNTTMNGIPVTASSQSLEIYKYSGKVYAKVGFNLVNKGGKVLADPGYKAYLTSAGGSSFKLSSSQTEFKVQPGEKKTIYYFTEIPPYMNTKNMKLQFTRMDETVKLELGMFSFKLPAATTPDLTVGVGKTKKITVNNNTVEIGIQNASVYGENDKGNWSFQLRLKNTGNKSVTLPTYELAVRSSTGKSFPIDAKALSGLTLKPLEEKIIPLNAQIPLEVEQNTLQLELMEGVGAENMGDTGITDKGGAPEAGTNLNVPVAYFTLPYNLHTDTQKETVYRETNQYGTYSYSLQSLHRFPWKDEDIVIAKLKITNTQTVDLHLPKLKGALKMDRQDFSASTELFMDKDVTILTPGESTEMNVLVKVPYTLDFSTLKLDLFSTAKDEKEDTEKKTAFLSLTTPGVMNSLETVKRGGNFTIFGKGKNAELQENKTTLFEGDHYNVVYTEMLLSSEEMRQTMMAGLQAYFRTADGQLYQATASQSDTLATPGIKQLVTFMAKLPKSVSDSDLMLYVGPGINGDQYSEPGGEATGFVDVSALALSSVRYMKSNLSQISFLPFTLSFSNSKGSKIKGSDSMNITVNYDLMRDKDYDMGTIDHKLILKIMDPNGQAQEKSLKIGTDLTEGSNNTYTVTLTNSMYKDLNGGSYQLILYEEMLGERIKLGSQSYDLYVEKGLEEQD